VGKPQVSYTPVQLLQYMHVTLCHASTARIMEYLRYYYPNVAVGILKEHLDEFNKAPAPRSFSEWLAAMGKRSLIGEALSSPCTLGPKVRRSALTLPSPAWQLDSSSSSQIRHRF